MATSRRRRDQRQRQRHRAADAARRHLVVKAVVERLPVELHADIHHRLDFLRRLAFASICGTLGHMLRQEAPWLILPGKTEEKATAISLADGEKPASLRTSAAMRGHVVIGSSDGWLVTADDQGALRMANPATGAQADLPAISTIPFLAQRGPGGQWFCLDVEPFLQIRFGGPPPPENKDWGLSPPRTSTLTAAQMRQTFYRKVLDHANGRWEMAADIGDAALFIGVNGSLCVSTREHQDIEAGSIYFTDDEVGGACLRHAQGADYQHPSYGEPDDTELRETGVYSLKAGKVTKSIAGHGKHPRWPTAAWFTPSFL
ncbi:hypothetical protein BAE44_0005731 [Dichanthelium oligosanthes]|uniref:KIB1-4 beta-propeller domain-containing protein n=1 Tax=Dichanthelium oligosanthes TaxID=888268 RepID=A0A1E5W7M8_9POAL|nr:hypothetical protein BAE44_0005731 [Dichanthelium oligosanthes]